MLDCNNFLDNDDIEIVAEGGPFSIAQWKRDLSVVPGEAQVKWFMAQMNMHRRQVVCELGDGHNGVAIQAGAMQWFGGGVKQTSGIKGVGDALKKVVKGKVTKESAVKPEYTGEGFLVLEPTYKYLLIEDVGKWRGGLVVQDGMFLAAETSINLDVVMRDNLSSAVAGGEGLFNLCMRGRGFAVLESAVPREELVELVLEEDEVKIDGPLAVAWDASLRFTVERSGKTLLGSAASGEGLVNVYRGTGHILMAPGV